MGPGREHRSTSHAFLELVRRARKEPVTERIFADCFGFDYADMEEKLKSFLKDVVALPTSVAWKMPSNYLIPVTLRKATDDQIGRILGDWLRMKGDSLRNLDPELSEEFLYTAGRVLERAYRDDNGLPPDVDPNGRGRHSASTSSNTSFGSAVAMKPFVVSAAHIHDPGLLAVYGLYEHDIGNDDKARELLEAAVKAKVKRPKAYLVLAELRFADATATPLGLEGRISSQQAISVLGPLKSALQDAPTSEIYRLILKTWSLCDTIPTDADLGVIAEGVNSFPRDMDLAYDSAQICYQRGNVALADKLIDEGLVFATPEGKVYFEKLRSSLQNKSAN